MPGGPRCCDSQRRGDDGGGRSVAVQGKDRDVATPNAGVAIGNAYSRPYFLSLRHNEARSMPRISAARARAPSVSLSTWAM